MSARKKPRKKLPLPLKQVRKEIPPPGRIFKDKKAYDRKKAKQRLRRALKI